MRRADDAEQNGFFSFIICQRRLLGANQAESVMAELRQMDHRCQCRNSSSPAVLPGCLGKLAESFQAKDACPAKRWKAMSAIRGNFCSL
jgi:hypothetical protein